MTCLEPACSSTGGRTFSPLSFGSGGVGRKPEEPFASYEAREVLMKCMVLVTGRFKPAPMVPMARCVARQRLTWQRTPVLCLLLMRLLETVGEI